MSDAPERITVHVDVGDIDGWRVSTDAPIDDPDYPGIDVEYVRADLYAALEQERNIFQDTVKKLAAVRDLRAEQETRMSIPDVDLSGKWVKRELYAALEQERDRKQADAVDWHNEAIDRGREVERLRAENEQAESIYSRPLTREEDK